LPSGNVMLIIRKMCFSPPKRKAGARTPYERSGRFVKKVKGKGRGMRQRAVKLSKV